MADKVKAVLFDLDGTLFDFGLARSVNKEFGGEKYLEAINELRSKWDLDEKTRKEAFAKYIVKVNQSFQGINANIIENFVKENYRKYMAKDVENTFKKLKKVVKVGLLTTQFQFYANIIGKELEIKDVICSEAEIKNGVITGKLNHLVDKGEEVKKYAKKNKINIKNIAYVGDDIDPFGVALCIFIGTKEEYRKRANYIINTISELQELIEKIS